MIEKNYLRIVLVLILVAAIAAVVFIFTVPRKIVVCGDNVCDSSENCVDCPKDCKCDSNSYCDQVKKKCISSKCGNGVCEPFENMENCCDDCGCSSKYEICETATHKCEMPPADISDQKVKELATEYFTSKGKNISSFGLISNTIYQEKPAKSIGVRLQDEMWSRLLIVTEDEQVFEKPVN